MTSQADIWGNVLRALEYEMNALCGVGNRYKPTERQSENVYRAFDLVDNVKSKYPDRANTREYFLAVIQYKELFVLSALAGGKALIETFKREPEFVAANALAWFRTCTLSERLRGLTIMFFAGRHDPNEVFARGLLSAQYVRSILPLSPDGCPSLAKATHQDAQMRQVEEDRNMSPASKPNSVAQQSTFVLKVCGT